MSGHAYKSLGYASKRDRLLLFRGADPNKGDVMAYSLKTGVAQWLGAAGKGQAGVRSRAAVYLADYDAVLMGKARTVKIVSL